MRRTSELESLSPRTPLNFPPGGPLELESLSPRTLLNFPPGGPFELELVCQGVPRMELSTTRTLLRPHFSGARLSDAAALAPCVRRTVVLVDSPTPTNSLA